MKKVAVISLGGSVIIPDEVNVSFLNGFKKVLRMHYKTCKFVLVCGGGTIARRYINALKAEGKSEKELSEAGIRVTRMNARFLMQFFGKEANDTLPENMAEVKNNLHKNEVVICGALRYENNSTSDGTAAKLANFLEADFINMTNVSGLYSGDPSTDKKAKLIEKQTWKEFEARALKIKFSNGQHFVLDQNAAVMIRTHKIKTYIVGPDLKNFDRLLSGKKFRGTVIEG